MATKKKYAYYLKGNKIGLVQQETSTTSTDLRSEDYGKYKSPSQAATDGLEIEYSYSPIYKVIGGSDQSGSARIWRPLGYTFTNGNRLAFVLPNEDFSSGSNFTAGDKVLVQDSSRWNGMHEIHSTAYNGLLVTTTRTSEPADSPAVGSITISVNFAATAKTITGASNSTKEDINNLFPSGTHYCFVGGTEAAVDAENESELFKVTADGTGVLTAVAQYTVTNGVVTESTTPTLADESADTVALTKVQYDPFVLRNQASFDSMDDEDYELDLARYQANAIVYYVKAQFAEDNGEFQMKEYFMREFKRCVEKFSSAQKTGLHRIMGNPFISGKW